MCVFDCPAKPPGPKPPGPPPYPDGEMVQLNLRKYCAVELLNALIIALGIVPPGKKKKKKGKGKGKGGKGGKK